MSNTAKLNLADFDRNQIGITAFNQMSRVLDGLIHIKTQIFAGNTATLNPGPSPGDVYVVDSGAIGGWLGHDDEIAIATERIIPSQPVTWEVIANWEFVTPAEGFIIWNRRILFGVPELGQRRTYISNWNTEVNPLPVAGQSLAFTITQFNTLLTALRDHGVIAT